MYMMTTFTYRQMTQDDQRALLMAWAPIAADEEQADNGYETVFRAGDAEFTSGFSIAKITDYDKASAALNRIARALHPWLRMESKIVVPAEVLMAQAAADLGLV